MAIQSQLSIETRKTENYKPKKEPSHILDWEAMKNQGLKKYLLLQVIRAINKPNKKYLSIEELSTFINRNTGVIKDQLSIYIENFIFYGFIDDSYSRGLVLNDRIYDKLEDIDRIIREDKGMSKL